MDATKECYPDFDVEATEIHRMKEECGLMAHDMHEQINDLLMKIDGILSRDHELHQIAYARNLSADDRDFLIHGNSKHEA